MRYQVAAPTLEDLLGGVHTVLQLCVGAAEHNKLRHVSGAAEPATLRTANMHCQPRTGRGCCSACMSVGALGGSEACDDSGGMAGAACVHAVLCCAVLHVQQCTVQTWSWLGAKLSFAI